MKIRLFLLSLGCAAVGWTGGLTVTFDATQLYGAPGGTLTFSGTITNNSGATVYINGAGLNLANFDPSNYDASAFLLNSPVTLAAGATSADLTFFTVSVPNGFTAGLYVGSFDVEGGDSAASFNLLGTGGFTADVSVAIAPVLGILKTHADNFAPGQQNAIYTITVSNGGGGGPTTAPVTVTEIVPSGLALVGMSGNGWTCPANGNTCTTSTVLNAGSSYPPITVTTNVNPGAPSSLVNQASATGGGPSSTALASDLTTISVYSACDVGQYGSTNVADVQAVINQALGSGDAIIDFNGDGVINVVDVQIVLRAALGAGCNGSF